MHGLAIILFLRLRFFFDAAYSDLLGLYILILGVYIGYAARMLFWRGSNGLRAEFTSRSTLFGTCAVRIVGGMHGHDMGYGIWEACR